MRKFLSCLLFCFVFHVLCMQHPIEPELVAAQQCKQTKLLIQRIREGTYGETPYSFYEVKELLDRGADPNSCFWDVIVGTQLFAKNDSARYPESLKIIQLFLARGADPNRHIRGVDTPEIMRLLLNAGANINIVEDAGFNHKFTLLFTLCADPKGENLRAILFALNHGADPNKQCKFCGEATCALNHAVPYWLVHVIALLQYGARLDIGKGALESARCVFHLEYDVKQAHCELLRAISEHRFDPHHAYTLDEYRAMGISLESAKLIQEATQKVNEEIIRCAQDDFSYETGNQNIFQFVRNREICKRY